MEPAAGSPGKPSDPTPPRASSTPTKPAPARSPLVGAPPANKVRSFVTPLPGPVGKPKLLPMDAPESKRRFNRVGIVLAIVICLGTIPFTYHFQKNRILNKSTVQQKTDYHIPPERRQWRMRGLDDNTEKQTVDRFGQPILERNYNMSDGAFAGPLVGMKRFYAKKLPDYEARTKDAEAVWTFPQFAAIREVVWELPDSYLYVWMREPRAEIDLGDNPGVVALPTAPEGGGDWVVIDNFRVGKDLVKKPAVSPPSPAAEKAP